MTARFLTWFDWLMGWEGTTYENDPDDSGGETKFGIDKHSHPDEDIRNLTRERAKQIYWSEYWTPMRADEMPAGVGEVVADIGVNNGKGRASRWLQETLGVKVDGVIGPKTMQALKSANPNVLSRRLIDRREIFYRSIARGSQVKWLRGWLNRNESLEKTFVDTEKD